jgi:hypothetical protein
VLRLLSECLVEATTLEAIGKTRAIWFLKSKLDEIVPRISDSQHIIRSLVASPMAMALGVGSPAP